MDELTKALDRADSRRDDECCYWVEVHGDESGSCFCEVRGEIFSFTTLDEAISKINEVLPPQEVSE